MILSRIPMPPSSNNMYVTLKGRRFKSPGMRAWEKAFTDWCLENVTPISAARLQVKKLRPGLFLRMDCEFFFQKKRIICKDGNPKKLDASNRIKPLHDIVSAVLNIDDCWIFQGDCKKCWTENGNPETARVNLELVYIPHLDPQFKE